MPSPCLGHNGRNTPQRVEMEMVHTVCMNESDDMIISG